jgi:hypothetical protein
MVVVVDWGDVVVAAVMDWCFLLRALSVFLVVRGGGCRRRSHIKVRNATSQVQLDK